MHFRARWLKQSLMAGMVLLCADGAFAQANASGDVVSYGSTVTVAYEVISKENTVVFPTSSATFTVGRGEIVQGFEEGLMGKRAGEAFNIRVPAAKGYGQRDEQLVQAMPRSMFGDLTPEVGMQFQAATDQGETTVVVIDMMDDVVIVDGNHVLAGQPLIFRGEILSVQAAR
jgi:FKBP-type peptidyl-prolyl cis-trans isomerase SlyD